ncbi:alcohol dehydrogenase catalytic domain-containing protein [uncultured Pantoea sp.]|jgi:glutathione-independent formaldehyde dehydrogenase|uniref:glutathione-independent formaldehyde dehydrogenase n=1 Tax=uncultured Pantoea sp. TaxID=218084 RepID=UPI0027D9BE06|nr:alcohol dehydrogenase catalytic domain-containing protein [uncultured Pantoea sp.]
MKAVVYNGPFDVSVKEVPDPRIVRPTDVIVRITTTNICGSDLHMYEGRTSFEQGRIFGHENLGQVIEIGGAVERVKVGDYVCLPFNVGCGFCENCEKGLTGYCLTANPGTAGAAYGFAEMGEWDGGQAELLRVPYADFNCLVLPPDAVEKEEDYVLLSDIFPTGWHATELAGLRPGESVAIYGAGPVGLMAAHSALIKGASQVFVVDTHPDRLALAEQMGAVAINGVGDEAVNKILEITDGRGTDCGCECVGYQCCNKHGHEDNSATLNSLVASTKATGGIGAVGVFVPQDPGGATDLAKEGKVPFDFGNFWFKGQSIKTGQCNVKAYNRQLARLIHQGRANPAQIISHRLALADAAEGYKHFDDRDNGWTKVILKP